MSIFLSSLLLITLLTFDPTHGILCNESSYSDAVRSGGSDVIVVKQSDGSLRSTPFHLQIGRFSSFLSFWFRRSGQSVQIYVKGKKGPVDLKVSDDGSTCFHRNEFADEWSPEEWAQMSLSPGANFAYYQIPSLSIQISFKVYLFDQDTKFVITDVDGTITESDIKGQIFSSLGTSAHHFNVVPFFAAIRERGYHIVYLTARSISQDGATRDYLFTTLRLLGLPRGPLLMSPKPLADTILDSTVGSPREAKAENLRGLFSLFGEGASIVKGAYGNVVSDSEAYQDSGIPKSAIYLINSNGHLRREDGEVPVSSYENELANIDDVYPRL
eukprot:TRINITY_DN14780_c0_g1_i1.p1 TRINITY_DN14780_c0_g1~~TRINITY_DN14780_c0_g1_i1.p1  ORF type:complete len:328 (-),score=26.04 TRINITY_DN14780_c0_g1_i1:105-1088(-)